MPGPGVPDEVEAKDPPSTGNRSRLTPCKRSAADAHGLLSEYCILYLAIVRSANTPRTKGAGDILHTKVVCMTTQGVNVHTVEPDEGASRVGGSTTTPAFADWPQLLSALQDAASMVTSLLESAPDTGGRREIGEWSVREMAVHLLAGTRMYAECLAGTTSPLRDLRRNTLDAFNAGAFLTQSEDRGPALACLLREAVDRLAFVGSEVRAASVVGRLPDAPWHAGMRQPAPFFIRTIVSELLLHGWDMAKVLGRRWDPDEATASEASRLLLDVVPLMFNPRKAIGWGGSFWIVESSGSEWGFEIHDGLLEMGSSARAGCLIRGQAFEIMLWTSGRCEWNGSGLTASGPAATLAVKLMDAFEAL